MKKRLDRAPEGGTGVEWGLRDMGFLSGSIGGRPVRAARFVAGKGTENSKGRRTKRKNISVLLSTAGSGLFSFRRGGKLRDLKLLDGHRRPIPLQHSLRIVAFSVALAPVRDQLGDNAYRDFLGRSGSNIKANRGLHLSEPLLARAFLHQGPKDTADLGPAPDKAHEGSIGLDGLGKHELIVAM